MPALLRKIATRTARPVYTCLIDKAHNELLDIYDGGFSEFFHLLHDDIRVDIQINRDQFIQEDTLAGVDMLLIGCPKRSMMHQEDVDTIVKYVREGGGLLVISDAGGDVANETNMNLMTAAFNIDIEATTVRDTRNVGSSVAPILERVNLSHEIANGASRIVMGSAATLCIQNPAVSIVSTNKTSVVEQFSPSDRDGWKVVKVGENFPVIATAVHGQGKVVVFGDVDMFSNDPDYGLNAFDNATMVKNACTWLLVPVEVSTIIDWVVEKMTRLEEKLHYIKQKCDLIGVENESLKKQIRAMRGGRTQFPVLKDEPIEDVD